MFCCDFAQKPIPIYRNGYILWNCVLGRVSAEHLNYRSAECCPKVLPSVTVDRILLLCAKNNNQKYERLHIMELCFGQSICRTSKLTFWRVLPSGSALDYCWQDLATLPKKWYPYVERLHIMELCFGQSICRTSKLTFCWVLPSGSADMFCCNFAWSQYLFIGTVIFYGIVFQAEYSQNI